MAKFKAGTKVTKSLEVSGNIVDLSGDVGTSGQILTAVESGDNEVKITASDGAASDDFGYAVAIGSNKIVVSALNDDDNGSNSGSVYVYNLDGTGQTKITASDGAASDKFGISVSVGNDKIVVGAYGDTSDTGAVYVYNLDGTGEVKITASDGAFNDLFGRPVAIGNNKIVVGAEGETGATGAVYVYDLDGSNEEKITASDGASGDLFGRTVAIGNNKIVVGAYGDASDTGAVYVYNLDGTGEVKITASDGDEDDNFGESVAVGNNKIVVGAPFDDDNGSVYVYNLDGTNEIKITASDGAFNDIFGRPVAIGHGKIAVGAAGDDDNGSQSGSVYVYNLDGTGQTKITASDGAASDNFGRSVAIGHGKIAVGAPADDDNGSNSGSAYVYDLAGTNWKTISASSSTGITNYIKCVCASATTLATSGTVSTLSWMSTTPSFSNGFSAPTATTITVPNDGLYLIGLNLDVTQTSTSNGNRYNHGFEVYINGSATGAEIRNTYIRGSANNSNHFDSSANATKTLKLSANDAITIRNRRLAGNSNSTLQLTTNSSIFVVQIA